MPRDVSAGFDQHRVDDYGTAQISAAQLMLSKRVNGRARASMLNGVVERDIGVFSRVTAYLSSASFTWNNTSSGGVRGGEKKQSNITPMNIPQAAGSPSIQYKRIKKMWNNNRNEAF